MIYAIYIHIPFCTQRCHYCDFYSLRSNLFSNLDEQFRLFTDHLIQEIQLYEKDYKNNIFQSLYIGGGTPSLFPVSYFDKVIDQLYRSFQFHTGFEFSIECNPESLSSEKMDFYKDIGVNRISLGCQTFNDSLLKDIGRETTSSEIFKRYHQLREKGFDNINFDFIFALVNQTTEIYKKDLEIALSLKPDHISAYSLILARDLLKHKIDAGELFLPEEESVTEQFLYTYNYLPKNGLDFYEVSNYAIPGKECKHNIAYWDLKNYLGLGPSACGTVNNVRYCNTASLKQYYEFLSNNKKPIGFSEDITVDKKIKEKIMLSLRCKSGLNLLELKELFQNCPLNYTDFENKLEKHIQSKLLINEENYIRVSDKGLLLLDSILVDLI